MKRLLLIAVLILALLAPAWAQTVSQDGVNSSTAILQKKRAAVSCWYGPIWTFNFDASSLGALTDWTGYGSEAWTVNTNNPKSTPNAFGQETPHGGDISVYTGIAPMADIEITAVQCVHLNGSNAGANIGLGFRLDSNGQNGYYLCPSLAANNVTYVLFKRTAGGYADIVTKLFTSITTLADGDFLYTKVRMIGSVIQFKVWKDGTAEPATWEGYLVDTSFPDAGYIGLRSGYNVGGQGTGPTTVDDLVIRGLKQLSLNDSNLYFSPYNWSSDGTGALTANNIKGASTQAITINPGAYLKMGFTGTSLSLNVDTSIIGVGGKLMPRLRWIIDGITQNYQLVQGDNIIDLASNLLAGSHSLVLYLVASDAYAGRWNQTVNLNINGLIVGGNAVTFAPAKKSRKFIYFGDSITEGAWVLGPPTDTSDYCLYEDATVSYAKTAIADVMEYGAAAFGGQSWEVVFNGDIPAFINAWNLYSSGVSRLYSGLLSPAPDALLVNMGTNGSVSASTVVADWLTAARAATGATCKIFVLIPFNGANGATITEGFNNYVSASGDNNAFLINLGADGVTYSTTQPTYSYDGLHPNVDGQVQLGALVQAAMQAAAPELFN